MSLSWCTDERGYVFTPVCCLILIQVDTFISNNKMCFDYGKEEASSKNK